MLRHPAAGNQIAGCVASFPYLQASTERWLQRLGRHVACFLRLLLPALGGYRARAGNPTPISHLLVCPALQLEAHLHPQSVTLCSTAHRHTMPSSLLHHPAAGGAPAPHHPHRAAHPAEHHTRLQLERQVRWVPQLLSAIHLHTSGELWPVGVKFPTCPATQPCNCLHSWLAALCFPRLPQRARQRAQVAGVGGGLRE